MKNLIINLIYLIMYVLSFPIVIVIWIMFAILWVFGAVCELIDKNESEKMWKINDKLNDLCNTILSHWLYIF